MPVEEKEVALRISRIFYSEFENRTRGSFLITRDDFRILADRVLLKETVIGRTSDALLKNHGLILGRTTNDFFVALESTVLKWRLVPMSVIHKEAKKKPVTVAASNTQSKAKTGVQGSIKNRKKSDPAAVWPFPTGSR